MTVREKIIVGVMCLTVVYGGYELLGTRNFKKTTLASSQNPIGELRTFVAEVKRNLHNEKIAGENVYVISKADTVWQKDPFIYSSAPLQKHLAVNEVVPQHQRTSDRIEFSYTGFMQVGDTKMAIIDGTEYATGESLPEKTFYVKRISPEKVIIGKVQGSETIELPITEFDSGSVE